MPVDLGDELREQICAWLRANDVNPGHVPANPRATLDGDQLQIEMQVRNAEGRAVRDPGDPLRVVTEMRTVPVKVRPEGLVARWLASR